MSKAFLFADLHCSNKQLSNLYDFFIQKNEDVDALIFAGDVVNMGEPVWFMEKFVDVIDKIDLPFLWVPGNNDFGRAYYRLSAKYKSLEGRVVELKTDKKKSCHPELVSGSRRFTGVGGSPASWSGQYAGENMVEKKAIGESVFISHVPPPGILTLQQKDLPTPLLRCRPDSVPDTGKASINAMRADKSFPDSSALPQNDNIMPKRRFADSPLVHICGHLHYRWGTAYLGQTKVIQLASLETGHYAIMDLETLAVDFRRF